MGVWILRLYLPTLERLLQQVDFTVAFGNDKVLPVPGGFLFPALAVGILTRIFHFHARIADVLGIRECFDLDIIIAELAARSSVDITFVPQSALQQHRHAIMRRTFYPFVTRERPAIDQQLVFQALDAWSWFWVGVEAALVFTLTSFCLLAGAAYQPGLITVGSTTLLAAIGLPLMRSQCRRYAVAQVREILADPMRAQTVRDTFADLLGVRSPRRHAA